MQSKNEEISSYNGQLAVRCDYDATDVDGHVVFIYVASINTGC